MNTTKDQLDNTAVIKHIVYELNDSMLLLKCKIRKNNKFYFTDIPISIVQFSNLLSTIDEQQFLINKIAEALFNKELFINHVSPFQLFKKEIVVKINDLFSFSKPLKYSA